MTKKDYILIADCLHQFKSVSRVQCEVGLTILDIADTLARAFVQENPRFNKDKFIEAIGIE